MHAMTEASPMHEVRGDPATIDGPWLTRVLEASGVARGATVEHVEFLGDIGTGQTGRSSRLRLWWSDPVGRPASIVGKFGSADEHARAQAFTNGTYLREWTFYDRVAHTVGVRAPVCLAHGYDDSQPAFALLLEDLSSSQQGDQLDGLSLEQIRVAITQAVALHAPRFGDTTIESLFLNGAPKPTPTEAMDRAQLFYDFTLPGFLDRLGSRLDPDIAELATRFAAQAGRFTQGTGTPYTLVHYDFRADNLLFGATPEAPPVVVVDWQTVNAGLGACDIAYLISGSFPNADDRRAAERDLLEQYRNEMEAAGVSMSPEDCWRDYRFGSLWGMFITVVATVFAAQTERGDDMLTAMAQRHGRQALDLDALELLESLD
jgi:aminoglycoside/choline kinase family phosphotransferase